MGLSMEDVKELIRLLDATDIVELQLELEAEGARLTIRKAGAFATAMGNVTASVESGEGGRGGVRPTIGEAGADRRGLGAGPGDTVAPAMPAAPGGSATRESAGTVARADGTAGAEALAAAGAGRKAPAQAQAQARGTAKPLTEVTAPMVGTFYRAPSPGAEPFVSVDDHVEVGQTLCIIEAMKLMNEIQSEVSGRIAAITAEDGQPVEYGQTLFLIEPD